PPPARSRFRRHRTRGAPRSRPRTRPARAPKDRAASSGAFGVSNPKAVSRADARWHRRRRQRGRRAGAPSLREVVASAERLISSANPGGGLEETDGSAVHFDGALALIQYGRDHGSTLESADAQQAARS